MVLFHITYFPILLVFSLVLAEFQNVYNPDPRLGQIVNAIHANKAYNTITNEALLMEPNEIGPYFEGCISVPLLTEPRMMRNGIRDLAARWPNAVVPYEIKPFTFIPADILNLLAALNTIQTTSCIRFTKRTNQSDYILFQSDNTGCYSERVGKGGGVQKVNLQSPGCTATVGIIIHECMHALGFWHEQSRSDRDAYIFINFSNIDAVRFSQFSTVTADISNTFDQPYDCGSIMHYSANAFSKNGLPTIIPKRSEDAILLGNRARLSDIDQIKLKRMYQCK